MNAVSCQSSKDSFVRQCSGMAEGVEEDLKSLFEIDFLL